MLWQLHPMQGHTQLPEWRTWLCTCPERYCLACSRPIVTLRYRATAWGRSLSRIMSPARPLRAASKMRCASSASTRAFSTSTCAAQRSARRQAALHRACALLQQAACRARQVTHVSCHSMSECQGLAHLQDGAHAHGSSLRGQGLDGSHAHLHAAAGLWYRQFQCWRSSASQISLLDTTPGRRRSNTQQTVMSPGMGRLCQSCTNR